MHLLRYTEWDGTQRVKLSADQVFEKLAEYLSYTDDVQQAFDWLLRHGLDLEGMRIMGVDDFLEFHLDCRKPGMFSDRARRLAPGDRLRLGELHGGALHYEPAWDTRPLLFLAAGTGLAPLWGLLREALRNHHQGPIRIIHLAHDATGHYLAKSLAELAATHSGLVVQLITPAELPEVLAQFRLVSRQTVALLCGHPASVEEFARRLYLAGLPRNQLLADTFLTRET